MISISFLVRCTQMKGDYSKTLVRCEQLFQEISINREQNLMVGLPTFAVAQGDRTPDQVNVRGCRRVVQKRFDGGIDHVDAARPSAVDRADREQCPDTHRSKEPSARSNLICEFVLRPVV